MALILDDSQIRRIVGEQAFHRGLRYAQSGQVFQVEWASSGVQLLGAVRGSRRSPYAVNVTFTVDANGNPIQALGLCSCPLHSNCIHLA